MLTARSEIGPYQKPSRDFTEKPPTWPKRRPLGKRGCACELLFIPGEQEHEHDDEHEQEHEHGARKNIDNYFFKFAIKGLSPDYTIAASQPGKSATQERRSQAAGPPRRRAERSGVKPPIRQEGDCFARLSKGSPLHL